MCVLAGQQHWFLNNGRSQVSPTKDTIPNRGDRPRLPTILEGQMLIQKDNLAIRNATITDTALLGNWWRDGKVMAHTGFPLGLDISDGEIITSLAKAAETGRTLIIKIDTAPDSTAEIRIKICDFDAQGRGYGTKFLKMLICELFTNLAFERITLDTNINNIPAHKTR